MNGKLVAGVLINDKGVLISGHVPYCVVKHENKAFWLLVADMLETLSKEIREAVEENLCEEAMGDE